MTIYSKFINNESKSQYELHVEAHVAKIGYLKSANDEIYLTQTEVPAALGGKGIGSQLVEKVLNDIEQLGLHLIPLCPFVSDYIQKHPEWERIVLKSSQDN